MTADELAFAVGTEAANELASALAKIKHCLGQLTDEQVWWRSRPSLNSIGNATRLNPKLRYFPNLNENMSVARSFPIHEQVHLEFRSKVATAMRSATGRLSITQKRFKEATCELP